MASQTRAELALKDLQNFFPFAKRPQQDRDGADIEGVRPEPKQMRRDAIQLSQNRPI